MRASAKTKSGTPGSRASLQRKRSLSARIASDSTCSGFVPDFFDAERARWLAVGDEGTRPTNESCFLTRVLSAEDVDYTFRSLDSATDGALPHGTARVERRSNRC